MSSRPALLNPADLARQRAEDAQYFRASLHRLIDMGMSLAEAVHRRATAEPATPAGEPAPAPAPAPTTPGPHPGARGRL